MIHHCIANLNTLFDKTQGHNDTHIPPILSLSTRTRWVHGSSCQCYPQLRRGPLPCTGSDGHPLSVWNIHPRGPQRTEPQPWTPYSAPREMINGERESEREKKRRGGQELWENQLWCLQNSKHIFMTSPIMMIDRWEQRRAQLQHDLDPKVNLDIGHIGRDGEVH